MATLSASFVLTLCFIFSSYSYEIEPLANKAGMIIEKGSTVKNVIGHWSISQYTDISELNQITMKLTDNFHELKAKIESRPTTNIFADELSILSTELEGLHNITQDIYNVLDVKRKKRASPFQFIGDLAKILFGTATEDDLSEIMKIVNENSNSLNEMAKIVRDQALIFKEEFKKVDVALLKINDNYKSTMQRVEKIQNITSKTQQELKELSDTVAVMNSLSIAKSFMNSLHKDYEMILNAILFAKQGIIHPRMLTLKKIFTIVNNTFKNKDNERYPLDSMNSFEDFTKLIDLSIYMYEGKLLYIILVPFTDRNTYTLYNVQPEFTNLSIGFGYVKPATKLYVINNNNKTYIPFSDFMLNKCRFASSTYICYDHYILSKIQKNSPCELKLIMGINIKSIESCDVRIVTQFSSHWSQSLNAYQIYFSVPEKEKIKIKCNNIITSEEIEKAGLIKLEENCQIESKDFKYKTPKTRTFVITEAISSSINLQILKNLLNIAQYNIGINNTVDDYQFLSSPDIELGIESTKIDSIIKRAEELTSKSYYNTRYYAEKYSPFLIITVTFMIIYPIYKKCKRKNQNRQPK